MDAVPQFDILGPLRVRLDGVEVPLASGRQRLLLAVLVVRAGRPVPVATLIDEIWGDRPPARVIAALQVHVSALRKSIGDRLRWTPGGYLLDVADQAIDARRFEAAVAAATSRLTGGPDAAVVDELRAADQLWRGEPLSAVPDSPLLAAERLRLNELRIGALEMRARAELALGRHHEVAAELTGHLAAHPTDERLARVQMLALYRGGRPTEARAVYRATVHAVRTQLGATPSAELTSLAEAIDRRDPTLDLAPPSLPVPPTRFVGRRAELDRLGDILGSTRLLTLTGPGGAGKTRLAVQLCRERITDYPDGLTWVDLSSLADAAGLPRRVADALSIREGGDGELVDAVVTRLSDERRLLILDNCEHLVESCAALAATLLGRCPGARLLVTSRVPLNVPGETVWPVSGLSVDGGAHSDALRLLAARARDVRPDFHLHPGDVEVAAALCTRLDGLPLAIEMVAPQLRSMSVAELAGSLARRLDLHAGRAVAARHRTLRAAVEWGHQLLPEPEQVAFRRLAVFAGGFTLDAARRVAADPDTDPPATADAVADAVSRLVESSFLTASVGSGEMPTRYGMLQTLHDYAHERLAASADATATRRRHAEWCRDLAEAAPSSAARCTAST
jgi:predicted ATPase/DNA-binding SARP family transcriptional activator